MLHSKNIETLFFTRIYYLVNRLVELWNIITTI